MAVSVSSLFKKAQRINRPARIGMSGGSGYGKSMTMLRFASLLAGDKRVAVIDTEKDSASLYAANVGETVDNTYRFDFDSMNFEAPFNTGKLVDIIYAVAADPTYGVLCIDSLSHFWFADGGILSQAQMLEKTTRMNGFQAIAAAKEQHYYPLVEAIIAAPIHLIVTLRSKNAYDIGKDDKGRTTITRLGEAPRFEESFLYELDLSVTMGPNSILTVDKTRYAPFAGEIVGQPTREWIAPFAGWLAGGVDDPYVYGDGQPVASTQAKRIFNEYRAAHEGAVPSSAEALKAWHKEQSEKEKENAG